MLVLMYQKFIIKKISMQDSFNHLIKFYIMFIACYFQILVMDYCYIPEKEDLSSDELEVFGHHVDKLYPMIMKSREKNKNTKKQMLLENFNANFQISSPDCYEREDNSFDSDFQHFKDYSNKHSLLHSADISENNKNEENNLQKCSNSNLIKGLECQTFDSSSEPSCSAIDLINNCNSVKTNASSSSNHDSDSELMYVDALSENSNCATSSYAEKDHSSNVKSLENEAHKLAMHLQYLNCITTYEPHLLSVMYK